MKTILYLTFLVLLLQITGKAQTSNPDCPNGDAEDNSLTNWTTQMATSTAPTQDLSSFSGGFSASRAGVLGTNSNFNVTAPAMVNGGVDYYGGFTVPSQGTYCFRIGNNLTGKEADMLSYSFQVTPNNAHFKFRYAVVLEDGGHSGGENPWINMYMNLGPTHIPNVNSPLAMNLWLSTSKLYVASTSDPYFKVSPRNSSVVYKDWQCVEYDLTPYMGYVVTFNFIARDCSVGAHFGYAYIDGLCTEWPAIADLKLNKNEFCDDGQPVIADASGSVGETRWVLEVSECDAAGNPVPNGNAVSQWFLGQQAPSNINVSQFFNNAGKTFECGKYYRVIVGVMNDCSLWHGVREIIHYNCPAINAGSNLKFCCGNGPNLGTLSLGQTEAIPGFTYQWSSYPAGFSSTQAQTTAPIPTKSTAYILTTRDPKGCMVKDSVIIRYQNANMKLNLNKEYYDGYTVCDLQKHYSATVTDMDCRNEDPYFINNYPVVTQNDIKWEFQSAPNNVVTATGSGPNFTAPNADGSVRAFVTSACAAPSKRDPVQFKQLGNSLIAPSSFAPNGVNTIFKIIDYGLNAPPVGTGPAYNAVNFKLYIFDRGGRIIRVIDKFTYNSNTDYFRPLINGDIQWDGRNSQGHLVSEDTYNYFLNLQYCGSEEMVPVCIEGASMESMCFNWVLDFWGMNYVCNDRRNVCVGVVYLLD